MCAASRTKEQWGFALQMLTFLPKADVRSSCQGAMNMDDIEKIDNVTWYGHCVIHLMAALNDLPDEAKLDLCQDLSKFIERQHKLLRDTAA